MLATAIKLKIDAKFQKFEHLSKVFIYAEVAEWRILHLVRALCYKPDIIIKLVLLAGRKSHETGAGLRVNRLRLTALLVDIYMNKMARCRCANFTLTEQAYLISNR